jgi:hypothetical protein
MLLVVQDLSNTLFSACLCYRLDESDEQVKNKLWLLMQSHSFAI